MYLLYDLFIIFTWFLLLLFFFFISDQIKEFHLTCLPCKKLNKGSKKHINTNQFSYKRIDDEFDFIGEMY